MCTSFFRKRPLAFARCSIWPIETEYCILAIERLICAPIASEMFQADVLKHKLHTSGRINATERTQLPQGDHATARLHRDWLRRVSESTGFPPTTPAKKIKISALTLTLPPVRGGGGAP